MIVHGLVALAVSVQPDNIDFVIAGTQKGGTSLAHSVLFGHPHVCMLAAEGHFFTEPEYTVQSLKKYFLQFPPISPETRIVGEKTPEYMTSVHALLRLHRLNPRMKVIIFLRDPVTRIFAWYNHLRQETTSIEKNVDKGFLVKDEDLWKVNHPVRNAKNFTNYVLTPKYYGDALERGHYASQLRKVFGLFPPSQVYIEISEDKRNWTGLIDFLGIDAFIKKTYNVTNYAEKHAYTHSRTYAETMENSTRCYLARYYAPRNRNLFKLLDTLNMTRPNWTTVEEACAHA